MKAKAKILLSGKPKTTKSTLANAFVLRRLNPIDAIEATAVPIYISSGGTPAAEAAIKVHRTDGSVAIEPQKFLVEKYTGREVEEDIGRIELQTDSDLLSDIILIDTPGTSSSGGDFSKRHDAIARAELEHADLRVHLTQDCSELGRLTTTPHQPILVVQGHKDTHIDMAGGAPFAPLREQWLKLERASKALNCRSHFCAPLIELGAKLLEDQHFERVLALAGCSDEAFNRLLSPRDCLASEFSGVPLALGERLSLLAEMSETLLLSPGQSKKGAWPVWRCALFFARYHQIKDINALRDKLSDFSGVPQLRQAIRAYLGEVPALRIYRALLDAVKRLIEKNSHELSSLRKKTADLEAAVLNAPGAVCEITAAAKPVFKLLRASEKNMSGRLLQYEKALTYLQSASPFEDDDGEARRVLQWLVESDCGIPFAVRQHAIEALHTE